MKIKTTKETLNAVMKKAGKIAHPKASIPILSHVAIYFDGETCTITANDSSRTYSERFAASGDAGQCTVEAGKLAKAVAGMKSGDLELTDKHVSQGRSKVKLESMEYSQFPQPDYDEAADTGLSGEDLACAVAVVSHAIPTKDVRYMLNGVHLTEGHAVATDGHRLAFQSCKYKGPDIIVPADSVRQMTDMGGMVKVSGRQLIIDNDHSRFSTHLIESKYVDWQRVVPTDFKSEVTFNCEDMMDALRTAQIGGELVKLTIADGVINLTTGQAESACDCECNESVEVGFNAQYLIDAITSSGEDNVTMKFSTERSQGLIDGRFVIMPVRI